MRKELLNWTALGSATFLAAWTGHAHAQAPFDWAGFYLGGTVGISSPPVIDLSYPNGTSSPNSLYFSNNTPVFSNGRSSGGLQPWPVTVSGGNQFIGSINAGYNYQLGHWVYGLEADVSYARHGSQNTDVSDTAKNRVGNIGVTGGVDVLFSVRPRIGVAVDRLLLFGTGGLAFGRADMGVSASLDEDSGKGHGAASWSGRSTAWRPGFILGGGAEYALTNHVTLKMEGLYYNVGSVNVTATGTGTFDPPAAPPFAISVSSFNSRVNLSGSIIRVGANVRF